MEKLVLVQEKKRNKANLSFLKKDIVLTISLILAIFSCFLQTPSLSYIDFHVLISLFNLMIAIKAFEELKFIDKLAVSLLNRCQDHRAVSAILILFCFFSSMFFTNDVALLTFVPLTLLIAKKTQLPMMETIILQTIAANIGSSFTPMGNPQNLFIYSHYGIEPINFFTSVLFMTVLGLILLLLCLFKMKKEKLQVDLTPIVLEDRKKVIVWGIVLLFIIVAIFGLIDDEIALIITIMAALFFNKKILMKIDFSLLLTFICFFIFVGNISNTELIHSMISAGFNDSTPVFFNSIILSQFISNVPASILIANFTTEWKSLLLGVNIGGLGTMIASLASVISYKLFIQANPADVSKYILKFSLFNFSFLAILTLGQYLFFTFLRG